MIYEHLSKIFIIATTVIIITTFMLIMFLIDDIKRKKMFGVHYKEDHFREYYSNRCLVSGEERNEKGLPEFIRYKGSELFTGDEAYVEGTRIGDIAVVNGIQYEVVSRKTATSNEEEVLDFVKHFSNCKAIVKIDVKENIYYLYCIDTEDACMKEN